MVVPLTPSAKPLLFEIDYFDINTFMGQPPSVDFGWLSICFEVSRNEIWQKIGRKF